MPGILCQRIDSERMTVLRYRYLPESAFPEHSHLEEQITVVLSGRIEFSVGGDLVPAEAGSVIIIPSGIIHSARVLGQVEVETLNVLAPRRTCVGV